MLLDHVGQVGDVLVRLLQQIGQTLVLLLVDQLPVALLVLRLGYEAEQREQLDTRSNHKLPYSAKFFEETKKKL